MSAHKRKYVDEDSTDEEEATERGLYYLRKAGLSIANVPEKSPPDAPTTSSERLVTFKDIGGLQDQIRCIKEMVLFPNLYPEVFSHFGLDPPKGVLFHGPPGTGKTLLAKALANECSTEDRKVTFIGRKATDFLNLWFGESERSLRLLFKNAETNKPSIIFLDELDGLAPARSANRIQVHTSIVCTLLALMDGLQSRGDVVVIGATNRIDTIDPALRRPGRFDRELFFPYPGAKDRREILKVHTRSWANDTTLDALSERTAGFSGSDLRSFCTEAVLCAVHRNYPDIHACGKLLIKKQIKVEMTDFEAALNKIVPSSQKAVFTPGRKLPDFLSPLLQDDIRQIMSKIQTVFPKTCESYDRSRLLIVGDKSQIQFAGNAVLYVLESSRKLFFSLESFFCRASKPGEVLSRLLNELRQSKSAVLWLGDVSGCWAHMAECDRELFESAVSNLDPGLDVLLLATARSLSDAPKLFSNYRREVFLLRDAVREDRRQFYKPLFEHISNKMARKKDELELETNGVLEATVDATEAKDYESMIHLYWELSKIIDSHSGSNEESVIISELRYELERFKAEIRN